MEGISLEGYISYLEFGFKLSLEESHLDIWSSLNKGCRQMQDGFKWRFYSDFGHLQIEVVQPFC